MSEDVLVAREERGNISVLTMVYRPYNLLGPKLMNAIVEQVEASQKASSRAIVIRSGLRHFSAGADLDIFDKRVAAGAADQTSEKRRLSGVEFLQFMELLPIPLIASVHGVCLYPIVNHPGWADDRHCHNGLWDYADDAGNRDIYEPLASEIRYQNSLLSDAVNA